MIDLISRSFGGLVLNKKTREKNKSQLLSILQIINNQYIFS